MSEARNFWGSDAAAKWWQGENARYERAGGNKPSEDYLYKNIKDQNFESVLEIGAGVGRLIGLVSELVFKCYSVDVNQELCNLVSSEYPAVHTVCTPAQDLSMFPDNSIDLVYSFQCLQHMPPDELEPALKEIFRVARKEVWLIEGVVHGKEQGERTHPANGGSFVHYYDKMFNCYQVDNVQDGTILAYRMRKEANA